MPSTATPKGVKYGWSTAERGWGLEVNQNFQQLSAGMHEQWGQDVLLTVGLMYGYHGGVVMVGSSVVRQPGAAVALTASTVNYVQRAVTGAVETNTVGWTAGYTPMARVTTDGTGITLVEDWRPASPQRFADLLVGSTPPAGTEALRVFGGLRVAGATALEGTLTTTGSAVIGADPGGAAAIRTGGTVQANDLRGMATLVVGASDPGGSEAVRITGSLRLTGAIRAPSTSNLDLVAEGASAGVRLVTNGSTRWTVLAGGSLVPEGASGTLNIGSSAQRVGDIWASTLTTTASIQSGANVGVPTQLVFGAGAGSPVVLPPARLTTGTSGAQDVQVNTPAGYLPIFQRWIAVDLGAGDVGLIPVMTDF